MPTWIRVRDTSTGHEFDVEESAMRHGLERLNDERYPDLDGPGAAPRPSKPFLGKDGKPAPYVHGQSGEEPPSDTAGAEPAPKTTKTTRTGRAAGTTTEE